MISGVGMGMASKSRMESIIMPITIVVEVTMQYEGTRSPFEDTKSCLKALLQQLEKATPDHPLPKENALYWDRGARIGAYSVFFPMKSQSVMELIKLTHAGQDLTPIEVEHSPSINPCKE